MTKRRSVLIVEDDPGVRSLLRTLAEKHCTVDEAGDGEAAIAMIRNTAYDFVILNLMLPKANGFTVSEAMRELPQPPKLIVLSAISRYVGDRLPEGTQILQKPFEIDEVDRILGG